MACAVKKVIVEIVMAILFFVRTFLLIPHGHCKYIPSCSIYARQSFLKYSLPKAVLLIIKRLLKCHPFSKGGYDPLI